MPPVLIFLIGPILIALFVGYLALRFVRAFERRNIAPTELTELRLRVEELTARVENQDQELQRISDSQAFTEKLLARRNQSKSIPEE